ncbi:MAG: SLC45 family MFS transporter [Bacteroidetes bacterium]|nr:SLC45 family MFS transporter [Bacteroidota bacterium]
MSSKKLSFWQIWNMSFGFLGIQFGFALQGGNMSRIFQTLGASEDSIPMLWIAAPLTGLIVQPIIGYLSDRTWHPKFGRRRPYFLLGAVLSSLALFFAPYSSTLWMAAGFLWIMDASINISMEPFRALVADKLPDSQRSYGFVVQTLIIGVGTWVASNLPWFMNYLGVSNEAAEGNVPDSVIWSFAIGAIVFMGSILWSVFTTTEEPPADLEAFRKQNAESSGLFNGLIEIAHNFKSMPSVMWKLGVVQFFSWFAFFTMWSFATPALTEHVYHAAMPKHGDVDFDSKNQLFNQAATIVSSSMGMYGLSSMAFALLLTLVTARNGINRRLIHMLSLLAGGAGFLLMTTANEANDGILNLAFALIGVSWGSILSMPYAILSSSVKPEKMGVSMGIFNMFIVIPQIVAALGGINWAYKTFLGDAVINTMVLAGIALILGALSTFMLPKQKG